MLKLKEVLASVSKTQADLARAVELSPAAIAQLINHGQWPKSLDQQQLAWRITEYLMGQGAKFDDVRQSFEEVEPPRANATAPASPTENDQVNDQECEPMLMPKQPLLPATRKAFGLPRDPFDELQSAEDMYISPDIRYVRECMYQVAKHDGFLAVIGESGAGKSTLRRDLVQRLEKEGAPVIVIEPYVLAMEDNDAKGKTLKSTHIAEAIMAAVAPLEKAKSSPEARFAQLHKALKTSHAAGFRHVLIIEEAHSLPIPTLKQLKRLRELEAGFTKLVSIILIGQPELEVKLSPRNGEVREVVQRIEIAKLEPVPIGAVEQHLEFRFSRSTSKPLQEIISPCGVQAVIDRLSTSGRDKASQLYPLAIGNLVVAAMNLAASIGEPRVSGDVVKGV
ncbi:ExeA family protein [Pseudomonas citronellolis]|uniref:ExeA family protein n=1 Tax=Pseudomonas citronellolis TaxID=53408 RepID=UPI0008539729|nr:AAA family ATPase [Pseudomonas humi]